MSPENIRNVILKEEGPNCLRIFFELEQGNYYIRVDRNRLKEENEPTNVFILFHGKSLADNYCPICKEKAIYYTVCNGFQARKETILNALEHHPATRLKLLFMKG